MPKIKIDADGVHGLEKLSNFGLADLMDEVSRELRERLFENPSQHE